MSLCDTCSSPGHCCRDIPISGGDRVRGFFDDRNLTREAALAVAQSHGLPFVPSHLAPPNGKPDGEPYWRWSCSNLTPEGRCGDYENRPDLCRAYVPASDALCVHWRAAEAA